MKTCQTRNAHARWAKSISTLLLLFALACGLTDGGDGGGSSGDKFANGGIGGTGVSQGPITDFGSIFVNGIEWFIDASQIEFDGETGSEADLRIGMVVRVEGTIDHGKGTGEAASVFFDDELEGPVEEIADVGDTGLIKELSILGKRVWIEAGTTRFDDDDDAGSDFGFDTIEVNDIVEVSGLVDSAGVIRATHVEFEGVVTLGTSEVELRGEVSNFNGSDRFELGDVEVRFDGTTQFEGLLAGDLSSDPFVEVEGVLEELDEILIFANEIELEDEFDDDDLADFSVTGFVTDFVDESNFKVGGYTVDASGADFENGSAALLEDGVRVEVEGERVGTVLIASEVEFEDLEVEVSAEIASAGDIDVANGRFVLLGISIQITGSTQLEDEVSDVDPLTLSDLAAGEFLQAKGVSDGAGGVIASEVKRTEVEDVELRGPLEAIDDETGDFIVLGQRVPTHDETKFELEGVEVTWAEFVEGVAVGDHVEISDEEDADATAIDFADTIKFEPDD